MTSTAAEPRSPRPWRRRLRRAFFVSFGLALVLLGLFAFNGLSEEWREPRLEVEGEPRRIEAGGEIRILAFNIAKALAYDSAGFRSRAEVEERLDRIAALIEDERADLVFLAEVVNECAPCPVDQVAYLGRAGAFSAWASSDNYSFGLPFLRIRSGNALLSRLPLRALETVQLSGGTSFWEPTNNRRILWCEIEIAGAWRLAASLRNDSFDLANNAVQAREILDQLGVRPALLAGDFNAEPGDASMRLFRESGRFSGMFDGPPTFSVHHPRRRIDYVLAPPDWELVEERVIATDISDHFPVLAVFRLPR